MASQQQVLAVQQEINDVRGEISEVKTSLAEEKKAGHKKEADLLWDRLEKLNTQLVSLREKENLLLRAQQNGGYCSLLLPLASLVPMCLNRKEFAQPSTK